jgi:UDP-2-acetamido-3-amino-2,3-dideoxy-glucuronate N-acetyltransferase
VSGADEIFVHETAVVDEGARIGAGTRIWHFSHVCGRAVIGDGCVLGQNVYIGDDVNVGNGVKIQNNVSVYTGVTLGDEVFLGPSCVFTNVNNPRAFVERKEEFLPTYVGRGATVGANATIVCGHRIGEYAFIGAGAVVTRDVLPHALMIGMPAIRAGWMCSCGERLASNPRVRCGRCGRSYTTAADHCRPLGEAE